MAEHLASWYGTEAPAVLRYAAAARLQRRLSAGSPILAGEIAYAVEHAAASHLSDAVLRRTALGSAGHPGSESLRRAAEIMGEKLGWDATRQADEVARVEGVYPRGM